MKLPRSLVFSLLAASTLFSLALRYPTTSHETGVDSFFIHNLTTSIIARGNAEWMLNPLSMFGLYPMSYPSAGPFLLASFSQLSAINVEATILLASLAFGAFGVVGSFVLAREFREDDLFSLAVAFMYSFAPRFLSFTLWTASTRGLFMVVLPIFVWLILRVYRKPSAINLSLLILVFAVLAAIHRLGILMAVILAGSIVSFLITIVLRILRLRAPQLFLGSTYKRVSSYLALVAIATIAGIMFVGTDVLSSYSGGRLASGSSVSVELLNLGVSLGRSVGLSLVFALLGLFVLVRSRNRTMREPFLIVAFLALIPTLFLRVYTGFYILPFVALLGGLAFLSLSQVRRRRLGRALLAVSFVGAMAFSFAMLQFEVAEISAMQDSTYSTATYELWMGSPTIVANDGLLGVRTASVSGCPYLPIGGAGTTFQGPELLAYGFFRPEEIYQNLRPIPFSELTVDSDSPWTVTSIQAESDWVGIMQSRYDNSAALLERYHPVLFLENRLVGVNFYAYGNTYPSLLAQSAHDGAYLIYQSSGDSLFYIYAP